jgi:hypothetical protein
MVYDAGRDKLVLFVLLDDGFEGSQTWEWNGADWQRQTSAQLPMLLGTTSLVYDARRGHVVLVDGGDALNDDDRLSVWDWDGTGWHDRAITQTLPPGTDQLCRRVRCGARKRGPVWWRGYGGRGLRPGLQRHVDVERRGVAAANAGDVTTRSLRARHGLRFGPQPRRAVWWQAPEHHASSVSHAAYLTPHTTAGRPPFRTGR